MRIPLIADEKAQYDSATGWDTPADITPPDPVPPEFGTGPWIGGNWIVWARNDRPYWVSTELHWDVEGEPKRWRLNLPPFFASWVSSEGWEVDASTQIPRNLRREEVGGMELTERQKEIVRKYEGLAKAKGGSISVGWYPSLVYTHLDGTQQVASLDEFFGLEVLDQDFPADVLDDHEHEAQE
jgi:hypothetical protein